MIFHKTDSHFNVEVKLMDSDTLPWENDDEMGRASTDLLGNYTVEGCAGDFGAWNDPDPYILITHRCPEIGHDISVIKRKLRIPIKEIKYLPNITTIEAFVETTRLDLEYQLIFVQTIWRHGDRSPIYIYPNDPNKESAWPNGFGELTTRGMIQQFNLGKFLGKRYIDELQLLSPHYRSEEIFVISTDTNRTIQSATANMMGMYGGRGRCGIDYPNLVEWPAQFVPIPIHSFEFMKDPMGYARHHCKRTLDLFALLEQTPEYKQLKRSSAALLSKISEHAGSPITLNNLWGFIETVNIERTHGLRSPDWVLQILPKALEIKCLEKLKNFNRINNRFGSDPYSDTKVEGKECEWLERLKYYAHSAHDMSISALFSTLQFDYTDFDRDGLPGYAACVLIELWRNVERGHYIKVLYRRDNVDNLINLTPFIRGCNGQEFMQNSSYTGYMEFNS
uniref:acid phosphatase n=1 Tax=Meloidogyne floridensis TaxID=298350 RepID=A0A915NVL9_9BILA